MNPFRWWKRRQAELRDEREADIYRARVCRLTFEACDLWEMPAVFVDVRGARIVNHPAQGSAETVLSYEWPDALDKLEADVAARRREMGVA